MTLKSKLHPLLLPILLYFAFLPGSGVVPCEAGETSGNTVQTILKADVAGQVNPEGAIILLDLNRRWIGSVDEDLGLPINYIQTGIGAGSTPAYGRVNLHVEWQPAIFANFRAQYDIYRYYGANTALLSFPSSESLFGDEQVDALEGQEEAGYGNRFLLRPTLYAKAGPALIMNRTDLAYFHFPGRGPYYLEWTYETLMTDGDHVVENRTDILIEAWKGPGVAQLLVGPFYEIMHASSSGIARNRTGAVVYWVPEYSSKFVKKTRLYAQAGTYLHDRNREGEAFAAMGAGFDFDL